MQWGTNSWILGTTRIEVIRASAPWAMWAAKFTYVCLLLYQLMIWGQLLFQSDLGICHGFLIQTKKPGSPYAEKLKGTIMFLYSGENGVFTRSTVQLYRRDFSEESLMTISRWKGRDNQNNPKSLLPSNLVRFGNYGNEELEELLKSTRTWQKSGRKTWEWLTY